MSKLATIVALLASATATVTNERTQTQRKVGFPLDETVIVTLALEAEMRGMRLGELIAIILEAVAVDVGAFLKSK